jgi:hypothetical protein
LTGTVSAYLQTSRASDLGARRPLVQKGSHSAAALSLPRDVRINAVSPGLAADSYEQFGRFNPGRLSVAMGTIASAFLRSVEGWRTGEIIRAR